MWYWTGIAGNAPGMDSTVTEAVGPSGEAKAPAQAARGEANAAAQAARGAANTAAQAVWDEAGVLDAVAAFRLKLREGFSVSTPEQVLRLAEQLGFCHAFTPEPPDRPFSVAAVPGLFELLPTDDEDTRWDWAWTWKDSFLESGHVYYGKLIHRKPTYVSSRMLSQFYAMTGNLGDEDDCANALDEARAGVFACTVYEHIAASGPTSTIELGRHFAVTRATLDRALTELQTAMLLVPAGTRPEGPRKYTYVWDIFPRRFPAAVAAASSLGRSQATEEVILRYLQLAGATSEHHICRALPIPAFLITNALKKLQSRGLVAQCQSPTAPRR
ncbi:MAG: helix-turn-helix domain-containing protein [Bacillota bacterium]